jgi:hypothetical protein
MKNPFGHKKILNYEQIKNHDGEFCTNYFN